MNQDCGREMRLAGLLALTFFVLAGMMIFRTGQQWSELGLGKGVAALILSILPMWLGGVHVSTCIHLPRIQRPERLKEIGELDEIMQQLGVISVMLLAVGYLFFWKNPLTDWAFWTQLVLCTALIAVPTLYRRCV